MPTLKIDKKPDAILTSDWHLRETNPKCRLDADWSVTMKSKMDFIKSIQKEVEKKYGYLVPVLHAGDLYDHWKPSPGLLSYCALFLPQLTIVPGNHDLPAHNLDNLEKSGIHTLDVCEILSLLNEDDSLYLSKKVRVFGIPFGGKLVPCSEEGNYKKVVLIHHYVYKGRRPFPGATGGCNSIMKKLEGYDLIVSGDNHIPFTHKNKNGQLLVNPGSLFRLTADQMDHKPRVYLWYAKENEVEPVYVPIDKTVMSRDHIEKEKERDERMEAFVSRLSKCSDLDNEGTRGLPIILGIDFRENIKRYVMANDIKKPILQKIEEAMDE